MAVLESGVAPAAAPAALPSALCHCGPLQAVFQEQPSLALPFPRCRKDESKEPIVEVRTEEERTPNHDGGKHTEPNETTPLTEPEYVALGSPSTGALQCPQLP